MARFSAFISDLICDVTRAQVALALALIAATRRHQTVQRRVTELEREVERLRAQSVEADRVKDDFLATLSHELRTPLNASLGWIQLLRQHITEPGARERALSVVERNTRAQVQIIADLLDVSRLVTGQMRLVPRRVAVDEILRQATESLRPAAAAKGLDLRMHIASPGVFVHGDPGRLHQIFWNLVSNAVKFTPPGGRIDVSVHPDDSTAIVAVRDTGVGIPLQLLPQLFKRFRQGDSSLTRPYGGLGLGLAIVRHLVDLHNGSVRAESAGLGQGATLTVTLPLGSGSGP